VTESIKTMKLYHQVGRVFNELKALGIDEEAPLDVDTLSAFDQYHYFGTEAVDLAIDKLGISPAMRVLEVGGGIGGPSRYLAHASGCHSTALELQPDLNKIAMMLTRRCGLEKQVAHLCGDILDGPPEIEHYDALVSWLTFLHIPDRNQLYQQCFNALKPGGGVYVEDYFERRNLTSAERKALRKEVFCDHVPSMENYARELADAGFVDIELEDVSESWTEFVQERKQVFECARDRNVALHGLEVVDGLEEFYSTIVRLFQAGNLGGISFVAWKPE
jgi:cyclopropane fatty-acyl-phospholipid synthase-like methyltransferase